MPDFSFTTKKPKEEIDASVAVASRSKDSRFSFTTKTPKLDAPQAPQAIAKPQQEEVKQEEGGPSFLQKAGDFFSGNLRATDQTNSLPELHKSGILSDDADFGLLDSAAALTATNPEEIAKILKASDPNIGIAYNKDGQGNVIPVLRNNKTGAATIINRPGLSEFDGIQGVGLGAALFPASKVATGGGILGKSALVGAKAGATQAALEANQNLSGGEFNPGEIGLAAAGGAVFEAVAQVTGAAIPALKRALSSGQIDENVKQKFIDEGVKLGLKEDDITNKVIQAWAKDADARTGLEREFDTTLSQGARTGDQAQLSVEDGFRSGISGSRAQKAFLDQEQIQNQSLTNAADRIKNEVAGKNPVLDSVLDSGNLIKAGIRVEESNADRAITKAYAEVKNATLDPAGMKGLLDATKKATDNIEFPKSNVPAWEALQKEITKSQRVIANIESTPGAKLKPVHITQVESMRKAISNYAGSATTGTDKRNVLAMKTAFDNYLDEAVIKGMFKGDEGSMEALKKARTVFRDYMVKFGEKTGSSRLGSTNDGTGSFLRKIILADPTDEQVLNSMWSTRGFGNKGGATIAKRYRQILGSDSPEWNSVRQAAVMKIIAKKTVNGEEIVDGAKTFSNLKAAKETGRSVLDQIFTPEEMAQITRFATLAKRSVPELVKSRQNPSGTGQFLLKNSAQSVAAIMPFVDLGTTAALGGAIAIKNSRTKSAASSAFKPFSRVRKTLLQRSAQTEAASQTKKLNDEN